MQSVQYTELTKLLPNKTKIVLLYFLVSIGFVLSIFGVVFSAELYGWWRLLAIVPFLSMIACIYAYMMINSTRKFILPRLHEHLKEVKRKLPMNEFVGFSEWKKVMDAFVFVIEKNESAAHDHLISLGMNDKQANTFVDAVANYLKKIAEFKTKQEEGRYEP